MKSGLIFGLIISLSALLFVAFCLNLHRAPRFIRNFEEKEYGASRPFIQPLSVENGLAVYRIGKGRPLLLFPYPHGHTSAPMAQERLADILAKGNRSVITFDVPGAYRSTREPRLDMDEMLDSATEALDRAKIEGPVDVVGHSMSGLCALAFAVKYPEKTSSLVLVSSGSGFPAAIRWGMPRSVFSPLELDYWRLVIWGLRVNTGRGDLRLHKKLENLMTEASFHDKTKFVPARIDVNDHQQGVPIRMKWSWENMRKKLSYADSLGFVNISTLVIVGRHDPEFPLQCSKELAKGIPSAELVVFEKSGHYPFIEESAKFEQVVNGFLKKSMKGAE